MQRRIAQPARELSCGRGTLPSPIGLRPSARSRQRRQSSCVNTLEIDDRRGTRRRGSEGYLIVPKKGRHSVAVTTRRDDVRSVDEISDRDPYDAVVFGSGRSSRPGFLPPDPAAYFIYGDPILAPCQGRVVFAEDGAADMSAPQADRSHMVGNH